MGFVDMLTTCSIRFVTVILELHQTCFLPLAALRRELQKRETSYSYYSQTVLSWKRLTLPIAFLQQPQPAQTPVEMPPSVGPAGLAGVQFGNFDAVNLDNFDGTYGQSAM